jgi:hypothetical protein
MLLTLLTVVATVSACGVSTAVAWTPPLYPERSAALGRWEQRPFTSYRIALRVEALGRVCYQQLDVRGEWVREVIRNTCDSLWVDVLTVEELFAMSEEVAEIPPSRCGPSGQPCPCHRVFTERGVYYDDVLGFPSMVLARSEVQYNVTNPDFWHQLVESRELPSCNSARRRLTIQVLALTPLE